MTRIRTMLMDQQPVGEPELRGDERSEAARSGGSPTGERRQEALPDPEVPARPARRRFTTAYKLEILRKADACTRSGQVWIIPFYFEDVWEGGHIVCGHGSTFEIASELLIISGRLSPGGKVGLHYFRWQDGKFTPVYFDPRCPI